MFIRVAPLISLAVMMVALSVGQGAHAKSMTSRLPRVPDTGNCKPPPNRSASVGLKGYRRYHANDSLIGKPIPCTYDDKVCFQYNLLFDPNTDRCQPIGGGDGSQCDLRPNKKAFQHGTGRILGVCKEYEDPCPGYRMEYDNRCYQKEDVRDVICGCKALPTRHFLGGVECRSTPPQPINVQQPKEDGRCHIPDLRFPDTARSEFYENPLTRIQGFRGDLTGISFRDESPNIHCTEIQARCFSNETVWVSGHKGCFKLLQRGPCSEDHIVAMDGQAVLEGRAEALCVHVRGGCPRGYKRMAFDGQCHEDRAVQISAPAQIVKNQFGQNVLIPTGFGVSFHPQSVASDICVVLVHGVASGGVYAAIPKPPCGTNNRDMCSLFEVESGPPPPEED